MPTEQLGSLSSPQHHCGGHTWSPSSLDSLGLRSATLGHRHRILVSGFHSTALWWFVYIVTHGGASFLSLLKSIPFCN